MRKDTFMYLCNQLRCALNKSDTRMRRAISVEKRVAVALWRLATNVEYRSIGHLFGISRSTACVIVHEVCSAINTVLTPIYIKIPTEQQLKETIDLFEKKWGFPQCAGAIDGSHIPIIAPTECHTDYFNRKGWHSIILQGVVGPTYKFWDINVGWPGRVHDARVFSRSSLYKRASEGSLFPRMDREIDGVNVPILLIGDPAYPLYEWLMKPFSDTGRLSGDQHTFNYRLSCARNVVENAYGRLKARWRCLLKRNDCHLHTVCEQVVTCCTLHNICETHGETFHDHWLQSDGVFPQPQQPSLRAPTRAQAERMRHALISYFSSD